MVAATMLDRLSFLLAILIPAGALFACSKPPPFLPLEGSYYKESALSVEGNAKELAAGLAKQRHSVRPIVANTESPYLLIDGVRYDFDGVEISSSSGRSGKVETPNKIVMQDAHLQEELVHESVCVKCREIEERVPILEHQERIAQAAREAKAAEERLKQMELEKQVREHQLEVERREREIRERTCPVTFSQRAALLGEGLVLRVKNIGERTMEFSLSAKGLTRNFILTPGESREYGWHEGFKFISGDNVFVSCVGKEPAVGQIT